MVERCWTQKHEPANNVDQWPCKSHVFSLRLDCQKYEGKRKEKLGSMTHITVAHDELDGKSRLVIKNY